MAWEEENIGEGSDFEQVGGGSGSKKKLIMIAVAVVVLLGGGYAAYKFFLSGDDEAAQTADGEEAVEEPAPEPEIGYKVDLDKFTLNVTGKGDQLHFLVTTLSLEVTTEELKNDLLDPEDKKLYMIKTRDAILDVLRQKTFQEASSPEASKEISKEIVFRLNRIYASGKARGVFFSDFVLQ